MTLLRQFTAADISIVIPTFGRDEILTDTIRGCIEQSPSAGEILVVDQTPHHTPGTELLLTEWCRSGKIRWDRLPKPSIPAAMNHALLNASRPLVLFLDDDVVLAPGLVAAHAAAHQPPNTAVVVGQIIQPWQEAMDQPAPVDVDELRADFDFPFHSTRRAELKNVMAGHMSVDRSLAIEIGGFDENFRGVAYRFETEFARRIRHAGGKILFEPAASLHHLRVSRGGTRTYGDHMSSASPNHGVGDYYFALVQARGTSAVRYIARRLVREVCTRFHLRHPWYIPVKLAGEIRALCWALQLRCSGPRLIQRSAT